MNKFSEFRAKIFQNGDFYLVKKYHKMIGFIADKDFEMD